MRVAVRTPDQLGAVLHALRTQFAKHSDKGLLITVEPYKHPRTGRQNSKIHAMLAEWAAVAGYSMEEMKKAVFEQYAPRVEMTVGKKTISVTKSVRDLTREEASNLIEAIIYEASECGVLLERS